MVDAREPACGQAPGKRQLQAAAVVAGEGGLGAAVLPLVEAAAVGVRDHRHIAGLLEPPLNLEAGDPQLGKLGHQFPGGQILGRQQIALVGKIQCFAVHHELVGQTTGLGTFAAVGAALAEGLTGEALAGVGHAQGAVHEHLQRHIQSPLAQLALQALQIAQAQLPCQHHLAASQGHGLGHAGGTGDRHLGGGMHRQIRGQGRREAG